MIFFSMLQEIDKYWRFIRLVEDKYSLFSEVVKQLALDLGVIMINFVLSNRKWCWFGLRNQTINNIICPLGSCRFDSDFVLINKNRQFYNRPNIFCIIKSRRPNCLVISRMFWIISRKWTTLLNFLSLQ